MSIAERYCRIRAELSPHVTIVLAAKTRSVDEVKQAISAGATDIGFNYVQEAAAMRAALGEDAGRVRWHLIGHLQTNKINKALPLFDMLQTVDSAGLAAAIDERAVAAGTQVIPVLIEVNAAGESGKTGVSPDIAALRELAATISQLPHLRLGGLMTMGPADATAEELRPFFKAARELVERLRTEGLPNVHLSTLSMGMSDSYRVAVDEGATMVRLGSVVFGERA
jgi:pyridoxal phosphate enzyme (YggS family)